MPTPPMMTYIYAALYKNLQPIVKSFVMYFFTPAVYKAAFFTGTLSATAFAGMYTLPKMMGGGTYYFNLAVPGPEMGTGLSFFVPMILAMSYIWFKKRRMQQ